MHELALAEGILSIATEAAGLEEKIKRIHLRIGRLQHVSQDSLQFAFDLIAEGTAAYGAQINVVNIPARFSCRGCNTEFELKDATFLCPSCGGVNLALLAGEEILVDSLELETGTLIQKMDANMDSALQQHMMEEHGHHFDDEQD